MGVNRKGCLQSSDVTDGKEDELWNRNSWEVVMTLDKRVEE